MKNKKGLFVIVIALLIIIIGAVLLYINSNNNDEKENDTVVSRPFTGADVRGLIYETMIANKGEMWNIGDAKIVGHNINNSKYLVRYTRVLEIGVSEEYESIVTIGDKKTIDFPGWHVGEKNLDEYGFIYIEEKKQ